MSLGERLTKLATSLQFAWFIGHLTLLLCVVRYSFSYITFNFYSRMARYSYRLSFAAAAATYGIVVYKAFRARARAGAQPKGGPLGLIADENVQYLGMALLWLFSRQMPLALLPFTVYSVFHVMTYTRTNLIPTIQPAQQPAATSPGAKPKSAPMADAIGRFVRQYYDTSMTLVAILEIALWFRILGSAILFTKGSWIILLSYTIFFRARVAQSTFVQGAIQQGTARADALVSNQSTPPVARQVWETVKGVVRQAADATDIQKYIGGQQPSKKAQ